MAYYQPPRITWDPPGPWQGVTIERQLDDLNWYAWRVPYNGVVNRTMAADLLGVSLMTISNWANAGVFREIKQKGGPALTTLYEIKRLRKMLQKHGRLHRDAI